MIKVLGEHEEDIKGVNEAKVEEDLCEVEGKLFAIVVGDQDTMHDNV